MIQWYPHLWNPQDDLPIFSYSLLLSYVIGGLEHLIILPYIGNVIIPTDELRFFRGVGQPPTSDND